jgi:hypothetical protein
VRIAENFLGALDWQVDAYTSHAPTVPDQPTNRAIERRGVFNHVHEVERRKFGPTQCARKPKPEQTGFGKVLIQLIRQLTGGVKTVPLARHDLGKRLKLLAERRA